MWKWTLFPFIIWTGKWETVKSLGISTQTPKKNESGIRPCT